MQRTVSALGALGLVGCFAPTEPPTNTIRLNPTTQGGGPGWYEGYYLDGDPYDGFEPQGSSPTKRIAIENDPAVLAERLVPIGEEMPFSGAARDAELTFTLVARLEPPVSRAHSFLDYGDCDPDAPFFHEDPVSLDAVEVTTAGDQVLVSYHEQGSLLAGAVDALQVTGGEPPLLRSHITFDHFDLVQAVFVPGASDRDGDVYVTGQTCDPCYEPYSALIERIELSDGHFSYANDWRFGMPGVAGTGLVATPTRFFGTTGDSGGLTAFDAHEERRIAHLNLPDARWVDVDGDRVVALTGGDESALHVYDAETLQPVRTIDVQGVDVERAKNTVEAKDGLAWVAAGTEGLRVYDLDSGEQQLHLPLPATGYLPEEVATNGVTVANDLVFLADGALGITVARAEGLMGPDGAPDEDEGDDDDAADDALTLEVLGTLDVAGSVNQILYRPPHLFVAAGTEGLLMIEVGAL
jgi:hypothetical protein